MSHAKLSASGIDMSTFPHSRRSVNLVRFCRRPGYESLDDAFAANFAFRDAQSRVSFLKNYRSAPGPDECFSHYEIDARLLFEKLLGMELEYPGQPLESRRHQQLYNSMNYYRSHIEEVFAHTGSRPLPPIEGHCFMHFPAPDRLSIRYELQNRCATEVAVRLRWFSVPHRGLGCSATGRENGFRFEHTARVTDKYGAAAALEAVAAPVPFVWRQGKFRSPWIVRCLRGGATQTFSFRIEFGIGRDRPRVLAPQREKTLRQAIGETEQAYARLPALPEEHRQFERLVLNAAGTLRTLRYRDLDLKGREVCTVHAGKCGVAATWFWDQAFSLLGLGLFGDVEAARGTAQLLLDGIQADGTPPLYYCGGKYQVRYQQPILAWGLGQYLALRPDRALLRRAYEPLARYVRHWLTACDLNGNGLAEYPKGMTCWDDALRWQEGFPLTVAEGDNWWRHAWGAMRPEQFENVDTNTHLYLECRTLAGFAGALGREEEREEWRQRAAKLRRLIQNRLYDRTTGIYQDRGIRDGRFTGMITPACFMPIYAGIAPREVAVRLCREYLLAPTRFYTEFPFPTLDRSHPAFRSGGWLYAHPDFPGALVPQAYWIGRAWPHVSFWMVGALQQAGLTAEADQAALRVLDMMSRTEAIYECYDSVTGYGSGHPEFAWSAAAALALAYRLYRDPPAVGTDQFVNRNASR